MEEKKKTIPQSKEWSLIIETWNKEKQETDIKLEQVIEKIKHETHYYFGITHDKDTNEYGELKRSHLHLVLKLKAKITLNGLLRKLEKLLGIDKNRISAQITKSQDLVIRYLMHMDNKDKTPYPPFAVITNRQDILKAAIKGEQEREDLTAENLILTIERYGGNKLKIMGEIGLKNYTRFRGTIADIIEELELNNIENKRLEKAKATLDNAKDIAKSIYRNANTQIENKINEKIAEVEKKVINEKAVELLNKKKGRL